MGVVVAPVAAAGGVQQGRYGENAMRVGEGWVGVKKMDETALTVACRCSYRHASKTQRPPNAKVHPD